MQIHNFLSISVFSESSLLRLSNIHLKFPQWPIIVEVTSIERQAWRYRNKKYWSSNGSWRPRRRSSICVSRSCRDSQRCCCLRRCRRCCHFCCRRCWCRCCYFCCRCCCCRCCHFCCRCCFRFSSPQVNFTADIFTVLNWWTLLMCSDVTKYLISVVHISPTRSQHSCIQHSILALRESAFPKMSVIGRWCGWGAIVYACTWLDGSSRYIDLSAKWTMCIGYKRNNKSGCCTF